MREIKFRVWDGSELHTVETIHFDIGMVYVNSKCDALGCEGHPQDFSLDEVIIMQYAGLKDKNGKEIYEGDILKGHYYAGGYKNRFIGKVDYVLHGFHLRGINQYKGLSQDFNQLYEVIGNIYENNSIK